MQDKLNLNTIKKLILACEKISKENHALWCFHTYDASLQKWEIDELKQDVEAALALAGGNSE